MGDEDGDAYIQMEVRSAMSTKECFPQPQDLHHGTPRADLSEGHEHYLGERKFSLE